MAILFETKSAVLNGHSITRVLPRVHRRMVGPFIFIDIMGPLDFSPGEGLDVPPHPHIGLSTLTYLFEGALLHQDNLGNKIEIRPGDVNWMTAGAGIVHSERQSPAMKSSAHQLFGMQCWVALPEDKSSIAPGFLQLQRETLPSSNSGNVHIRLIAGTAYGLQSSISNYSPMFFVDIEMKKKATLEQPDPQQECMLYLLDGNLKLKGETYQAGQVLILDHDDQINAETDSRFLLLGGQGWEKIPYIDWNFVAFEKEDLEKAKQDWRNQAFPTIPGDSKEFIPLPD